MKTVYLSLGSNRGDRAGNIAKATQAMAGRGVRVIRQSSLYETEPVEARGGWFLNCVIEAEVDMMPRQLINVLLAIERSLGRRRVSVAEGLKESRTIECSVPPWCVTRSLRYLIHGSPTADSCSCRSQKLRQNYSTPSSSEP